MEPFKRENAYFSLCGLNCCLCPRFNTDGSSRCPGCGGEGFSRQHPTCAVATCNGKRDGVEYCFQCREYPCARYGEESACDSFISYKSVKQNFNEARADLERYLEDLGSRRGFLKTLLRDYNDGKSKGLYCLVANDMPLPELASMMERIGKLPVGMDVKEKARRVKDEIFAIEAELGLTFKLRPKRG